MLTAVLDTCALWPGLQRDYLLELAEAGAYRPRWSDEILAELQRCEAAKLVRRGHGHVRSRALAERLVVTMRSVFPEALVEGYGVLEGSYGLPDPLDEHVVAAAQTGQAHLIVTDNIRDFPRRRVPSEIEVVTTTQFVSRIVESDRATAISALHRIVSRTGRSGPRLAEEALIEVLEQRYGWTEVARMLREIAD